MGSEMCIRDSRFTLWSDSGEGSVEDAELSAILAQFGPALATRQIAMNHQTCDPDERSGVRHAIPRAPATGFDTLADFDDIG